jgi:hypothetical protein
MGWDDGRRADLWSRIGSPPATLDGQGTDSTVPTPGSSRRRMFPQRFAAGAGVRPSTNRPGHPLRGRPALPRPIVACNKPNYDGSR